MQISYDPQVDMLGIVLKDGPVAVSEEVAPDVVLDFDQDGGVVGIEIEHASKHADLTKVLLAGSRWARPELLKLV